MAEPADWVIVGQRMANGDGVVLLASNQLEQVRLREVAALHGSSCTLSVDLKARIGEAEPGAYVKVRGANYTEALARLFEQWRIPELTEAPPDTSWVTTEPGSLYG